MAKPRAENSIEQGSLAEEPFAELLLRLFRLRFSGALRIEREGTEKRIALSRGEPVLAESNAPHESIGAALLDAKKISRADHARLVAAQRKRKCREETALLALQLVEAKDLYAALKLQVRRRLLDAVGWESGRFEVGGGETPAGDARAMRCDPIGLTHEGVAIHWSPARVRNALSRCLDRYAIPTERAAALATRLAADPETQSLCAALDGTRRVGEALATASPVAWAALWVLDRAGAYEYRETPVAPEDADPQATPEAEALPVEFEIVVGGKAAPGLKRDPAGGPKPAKPQQASTTSFRDEILALHRKLGGANHYTLLGLERDSAPAVIKRAYFQLAKRLHPDALTRLRLDEVRSQAQEVFSAVAKAYEVLSDPKRRHAYDEELESGSSDGEVARLVQAETLYRKAEILLRAGKFADALEFLRPAVELWPDDVTYQADLGWALYRKAPADLGAARTHLEEAVKLDRRNAQACHRLGLVLRALGEREAGQAMLARAKVLDPKIA